MVAAPSPSMATPTATKRTQPITRRIRSLGRAGPLARAGVIEWSSGGGNMTVSSEGFSDGDVVREALPRIGNVSLDAVHANPGAAAHDSDRSPVLEREAARDVERIQRQIRKPRHHVAG